MLNKTVNAICDSVPFDENTYLAEDGLLHCSICGEEKQTRITIFGKEKTVPCICSCRKKELEQKNNRLIAEEIERNRKICFKKTKMHSWNFDADDLENPKLTNAGIRYVENFPRFLKEGKGLLLHGPVGPGKTFMAACIANALLDKRYKVLMTSFSTLIGDIPQFEGKQRYIDSLNNYQLLILDDLGVERKTEYMQEQVYNIVDARYKSGLPFIVTTNISIDEIKKPADIENKRIYDRILECCHPIKVDGASRRRKNIKQSYTEMQNILGL